ncbi:MAG: hypothetical protein L6V93_08770 [Clostridiales bacterium]|nr:MAG: hypothetical protein L6V93_08770 [Clostridiales bacterium]
MYYGIGGHEGYLCEDGIEKLRRCFRGKTKLSKSQVLHGNLFGGRISADYRKTQTFLPLKYDYFAVDALVFEKNVKSNSVTPRSQKRNEKKIKVDFAGF